MSEMNSLLQKKETVRAISAGGITLALAEVLSLLKVYEMPQGGSVTPASMLPVILFGLCFGPVWGFGVAFGYSLLQMMIGGYIIGPIQAICDYTLAFSILGISGLFAAKKEIRIRDSFFLGRLRYIPFWKIFAATILGISGRLVFATISGVVFFSEYVSAGQSVLGYSLGYNASYLAVEAAITVAALLALSGVIRHVPESRSRASKQ